MNISLIQKRFLIIWCILHLFAYLVNIVPIKGEIIVKTNKGLIKEAPQYIFTIGEYDKDAGFWPFVTYTKVYNAYLTKDEKNEETIKNLKNLFDVEIFRGIFYNYNTGTFLFYIFLGFGVVFIPKLWGKK